MLKEVKTASGTPLTWKRKRDEWSLNLKEGDYTCKKFIAMMEAIGN